MNVSLYGSYMAETATIRVTQQTRDLLAEQARERGMSLSAMLTELAHKAHRDAIFRAEREAARRDSATTDVLTEERDWEAVVADGVE
jgi:hypothetical protein